MKKVIGLIICFSIVVFAQDEQCQQQEQNPQQQYDIDAKQQRKKSKRFQKAIKNATQSWAVLEIQMETSSLSPAEKKSLYEINRKDNALSLAGLNFFPGFGLGSHLQGDRRSGIKLGVIDGIAAGIFFYGFIFSLPMAPPPETKEKKEEMEKAKCHNFKCTYSRVPYMFNTGFAVWIVGRILGLMHPSAYQEKYNKALKSALNINDISYSIDPLIGPKEGVPAVGLAFNLHY